MRTRSVLMAVVGALAGATLVAGSALPAAAQTSPAAPAGPDLLILSVTAAAQNTTTPDQTVTLDCGGAQPPGTTPTRRAPVRTWWARRATSPP